MYPAAVGGFVLPSDLAPAIVFAVLYGLLLPLVIYRLYDRRSRTILLLGTSIFAVERIVIFSLRAVQSQMYNLAASNGLLKYMQASFGVGFVGIANDLVNLVRCLLINPTYGAEKWDESPSSATKESHFETPKAGDKDKPKERFWVRRFADFANLAFLAASIPGGISNGNYSKNDFDNEAKANKVFNLRYVSTGVALFLIIIIAIAASWSRRCQARACHKAINVLCGICFLTSITATYRLSVMWHKSPSLDSTLPGTLNSPGAKASFYILHVLPEWLATAFLLGFDVRKIFGTGAWGDYRGADDTPKKVAKRRERKAKRAAKKGGKKDAEKNGVYVNVAGV